MAIQSSLSKIGDRMLTMHQMRDAVKKLPDNLLNKPPKIHVNTPMEEALPEYFTGDPADKIPDVAHFIWFSGKASLGGTPFKAIPPKALATIQRFKRLNPHFQVKLWTDAPHLMERAIRSAAHESGFPPVQVESFFKLFSDATPWPGYRRKDQATLHAAVLRELHRTNRNPQAAKDIAQFVVLRHEPGWFFDLDAEFYKPLPKVYAASGSACHGDNGKMAFTAKGRETLDKILKIFSNTYDPKHDISFTREDFQTLKAVLAAAPDLEMVELRALRDIYEQKLYEKGLFKAREGKPKETVLKDLCHTDFGAHDFFQPERHLNDGLEKHYVMFDLKGTTGRRVLTDKLCLSYKSIVRGCDFNRLWQALWSYRIAKVPHSSVFETDSTVECWQDLPGLRRRASSPELPTWISTPPQGDS